MFHSFTLSGTVRFIAIILGTPTSLISIIGSGLITVLAQKFVLLPAKLCLILPSLLFILSVNVFKGCPERCLAGGNCAMLLSKNVVTWYCNKSHKSSTMISGAPAFIFSNNLWFILIISLNLWVRSSSLLSPVCNVIEGLIVTGGIGNIAIIPHSGLANFGSNPNNVTSASEIFSSLVLISITDILLSPSMKVVGFSILIVNCLALQ